MESVLRSELSGSTGWCGVCDDAVVSVVGVGRGAVPVPADSLWVGGTALCRFGIGGCAIPVSTDSS